MKQLLFIFLCALTTSYAVAQGLTKNGKLSTTGSEYVNKNGALGASYGIDNSGREVAAVSLPILSTTDISSLSSTSASSGATVVYDGSLTGSAKGVCWSTSTNPTIALDTKTIETTTDISSYSSSITGLIAKTTYYMRSYISTSAGTAYGDEIVFRTIVSGDDFGGGVVGYILGPGVAGYNKNVQKAYIARNPGPSYKLSTSNFAPITSLNHGTGDANTQAIIGQNASDDVTYAARICADLSIIDPVDGAIYDDWFVPSKEELAAVLGLRGRIGVSTQNNGERWMTSSQSQTDGSIIWWWKIIDSKNKGAFYESGSINFTAFKAVFMRISSAL